MGWQVVKHCMNNISYYYRWLTARMKCHRGKMLGSISFRILWYFVDLLFLDPYFPHVPMGSQSWCFTLSRAGAKQKRSWKLRIYYQSGSHTWWAFGKCDVAMRIQKKILHLRNKVETKESPLHAPVLSPRLALVAPKKVFDLWLQSICVREMLSTCFAVGSLVCFVCS